MNNLITVRSYEQSHYSPWLHTCSLKSLRSRTVPLHSVATYILITVRGYEQSRFSLGYVQSHKSPRLRTVSLQFVLTYSFITVHGYLQSHNSLSL